MLRRRPNSASEKPVQEETIRSASHALKVRAKLLWERNAHHNPNWAFHVAIRFRSRSSASPPVPWGQITDV